MEYFVAAALLALSVVVSLLCARHQVRSAPGSPAGIVLQSIDDRLLWAGVAIGGSISVATWLARAHAPALAWAWHDFSGGLADVAESSSSVVALIILSFMSVSLLVTPAVILLGLSELLLLIGLMRASWRREFGQQLRPLRTFVVCLVIGVISRIPSLRASGSLALPRSRVSFSVAHRT